MWLDGGLDTGFESNLVVAWNMGSVGCNPVDFREESTEVQWVFRWLNRVN